MNSYYVYIMSNRTRVLYVGVTNNLERRVMEHKSGTGSGFTTKYQVVRLVYFEDFRDIRQAIRREKEIKGWLREKKIALVETINPEWRDLSRGWWRASAAGRIAEPRRSGLPDDATERRAQPEVT